MSYTMETSKCIGCDRCQQHCPTGAIKLNGNSFQIDPNICNNCVGYYGTPQCVAFCPTNDGFVPDDFWGRWFKKYNHLMYRLHQPQQAQYWEKWFDIYSQKWSEQLTKRNSQLIEVEP